MQVLAEEQQLEEMTSQWRAPPPQLALMDLSTGRGSAAREGLGRHRAGRARSRAHQLLSKDDSVALT